MSRAIRLVLLFSINYLVVQGIIPQEVADAIVNSYGLTAAVELGSAGVVTVLMSKLTEVALDKVKQRKSER